MHRLVIAAILLVSFASPVFSLPVDPQVGADPMGDQAPRMHLAEPGQTYLDLFSHPGGRTSATDLDPGLAPEGDYLGEPVFTLDGERVLVGNRGTNNVTVFDWETMQVLANVDVGSYPQGIAVTEQYAIVACAFSDEVWVIDLAGYNVVAVLPTAEQPWVVRTNSDGTRAFVACDIGDICEVFDLTTLTHERSISGFPIYLLTYSWGSENSRNQILFNNFEVTADGQYVFAGNYDTKVLFFDTDTGLLAHSLTVPNCVSVGLSGDGLFAVAISVTNPTQAHQIDLTGFTVTGTVSVTGYSLGTYRVAVNADGSKAFMGVSSNSSAFVGFSPPSFRILSSTYTPFSLGTSPDHNLALGIQYRFSVLDFASESLLGQWQGISVNTSAVSPVGNRVVGFDPIRDESLNFYDYSVPGAPQHRGAMPSGLEPEGDAPRRVAITPDGTKAVVTSVLSDNATIIDLATNTVSSILAMGDRVQDVAITSDSRWAVVAGYESASVLVVDLDTERVVAEVSAGTRAAIVTLSPDDTHAYVGNISANTVSVIALAGPASYEVTELPCGVIGFSLAGFGIGSDVRCSPAGDYVLIAASFDDQIKVLDTATNTIVASLTVGDFPIQIAFDDDGSHAIVTNWYGDSYSVIRVAGAGSFVVDTLAEGDGPLRSGYDGLGHLIGIGHYYDNTLVSVEPETGRYSGTHSYPDDGSLLQVGFDETGAPLALTASNGTDPARFHWGDEAFGLPAAPSYFAYCPAVAKAAVTMPGPDHVTLFERGTTGVESTTLPLRGPAELLAPSPNPTGGETRIGFRLGRAARASVAVYDLRGQRVVELTTGDFGAGPHALFWDGCDAAGRTVAAGTYYLELEVGGFRQTRKVVFVK